MAEAQRWDAGGALEREAELRGEGETAGLRNLRHVHLRLQQQMLGLQLPWLSGIDVGAQPDDLAAFSGTAADPGESLPVPVIPKKC